MNARSDTGRHRLFLDANVLFSAAYGSPGLLMLWELAHDGKAVLLTSSYTAEEAVRNLDHPEHRLRLAELLKKVIVIPSTVSEMPSPVPLPEKDRPVLLAAIQAKATHLITGDLRHFGLYRGRSISGVLVCTPRDYLKQF
ncbi:MAG: PIN domain-containing protein [Bacillota bacterium]